MFVRVRAPRYRNHRAALRDCLPMLVALGVMAAALAVATVGVRLDADVFREGMHTRMPGLVVGAVIALLAQAVAIGVSYTDHLRCQRRRAETETRARCTDCSRPCGVDVVFDLPRDWRSDGVSDGEDAHPSSLQL